MLRSLLITTLLMIALPLLASAQNAPSGSTNARDSLGELSDSLIAVPRSFVSINPGGLTADYINLSYYRALSRTDAIGVYAGYIYRPIGGETITGTMFGVAYRLYPAGRALWRFYIGPLLNYQ